MSTFNLQTGKVVQVGRNGLSPSGINPDRGNFAPRVGFAWSPARDTVVRGGYGLYYDAGYLEVNSATVLQSPAVYAAGVLPDAVFSPESGDKESSGMCGAGCGGLPAALLKR